MAPFAAAVDKDGAVADAASKPYRDRLTGRGMTRSGRTRTTSEYGRFSAASLAVSISQQACILRDCAKAAEVYRVAMRLLSAPHFEPSPSFFDLRALPGAVCLLAVSCHHTDALIALRPLRAPCDRARALRPCKTKTTLQHTCRLMRLRYI